MKKLVRKSLDVEGDIRLLQIERQIEVRALLGDLLDLGGDQGI